MIGSLLAGQYSCLHIVTLNNKATRWSYTWADLLSYRRTTDFDHYQLEDRICKHVQHLKQKSGV